MAKRKDNHEGVVDNNGEITPHMERLLRVIREGSLEMVGAAVDQLYNSCSSMGENKQQPSETSVLLLWRILGRLQTCLCGNEDIKRGGNSWKSRVQTSHALERIASLVPLKDQLEFWRQQQPHYEEGIPAKAQIPNPDTAKQSKSGENQETITPSFSKNSYYLSLDQAESPSFWNDLLRYGRPLYVTAASQWEQDQLELEKEQLQQLTTTDARNNGDLAEGTIVHDRTKWQRDQLARRLGLNALLFTNQDTSYLVDNPNERNHSGETEETKPILKKKGKKKTTKSKESNRRKRKRIDKNEQDLAKEKALVRASAFQNLLVLEVRRSMNPHSKKMEGKNCALSSQLNLQQLLATELLYHMLDPSWQIRHGALLGLLALVRSWQHSLISVIASTEDLDNKVVGGRCAWPHDLLVRTMAILVLDRFGDFSGAFSMQEDMGGKPGQDIKSSDIDSGPSLYFQGGVVAPIRETAGQLIALLCTLFPARQQVRIVDVLEHRLMCLKPAIAPDGSSNDDEEVEDIWEIRQGVLASLKYMVVLLWRKAERDWVIQKNLLPASNRNLEEDASTKSLVSSFRSIQPLWDRVERIASCHLQDPSDDVVCMAAQILREMVKQSVPPPSTLASSQLVNDDNVTIMDDLFHTSNDLISQLYKSLDRSQPFSSSVPDLIALLSELLACKNDIGRVLMSSHRLEDVFGMLSKFLDSDYESVRISAVMSLGSLSFAIGYSQNSIDSFVKGTPGSTRDIISTCKDIILRLFSFFLQEHDIDQSAEKLSCGFIEEMEKTWRQLANQLSYQVFKFNLDAFMDVEKDLYLSLFRRFCAPTGQFHVLDKACEMVAFFSSRQATCFPSRVLQLALKTWFQTPWVAHCEAGCLLLRSLATNHNHQYLLSLQPQLHSLLFEDPLCIKIRQRLRNLDTLADPAIIHVCDKAMVHGIEMAYGKQNGIESVVSSVSTAWGDAFRELPCNEMDSGCGFRNVEVERMRIMACASSAALAYSVPSKITPFVRPLVSSLNSETCETRLTRTIEALTSLLGSLAHSPSHATSYFKIFGTLCDTAIKESRGKATTRNCTACNGVRIVSRKTPVSVLREKICPIWKWLDSLETANGNISDEDMLSALHLAWVLVFRADFSETYSFLATALIGRLVSISLYHNPEEARTTAISVVQCLCSSKFKDVIQLALETLVDNINYGSSTQIRSRGCMLLEKVVEASGSGLLPFVRSLFPVVMRLMRDRDPLCSGAATSVFSSLVQLAPVVRLEDSISLGKEQDTHTSAVIDHLILGKPIPSCHLPPSVSNSLSDAGISLRAYQEEGVSWLSFLQSVHLNGALCGKLPV